MSSTPPSGGRLFVEPLEARIAPTGLLGLANNTAYSTDANYLAYNTPAQAGHLSFVPASQVDPAITDPSVYALRLSGPAGTTAGDHLVIYNQATGFDLSNPYLNVTAGNVIAFFQDKNHDGQVQTNELVGLAMGKKSGVSVLGTVDGDIATNLANDGTLMLNSVGTPGFKLNSLFVQGNVNGNILSGGDLGDGGSIRVTGTVHNILAGTAVNNNTFNFSGTPGAVDGTINSGLYKDGRIGASISNVTINGLVAGGHIQAGDGGLGAVGGNVNTLVVQSDTDAFSVLGGAGGVGNATLKGGVGGAVNNVLIEGVAGTAANHTILVQGGKGGGNDVFKAGAGGAVTGVATSFLGGFNFATNSGTQSPDLLAQDISVHGGDGGDGLRGGTGGSVSNSSLFGAISSANNGVAEIQVVGGHGGTDTAGNNLGKGGDGGGISGVIISNLDALADANNSTILVQGGDGGLGKNGGDVANLTLLGKNLIVAAGNGTDGYGAAGSGGSLLNINVANQTNLFTTQLTLDAGQGGNAGGGNGGNGGNISTVNVTDAAFTALTINGNAHGNGGSSEGALGGSGGTVSGVNITNSEANSLQIPTTAAPVTIRSGAGGNGQLGGGSAGSVSGLSLLGTGFSYAVTTGAGGSINGGGTGDGGAGGSLMSVSISNFLDLTGLALAPAAESGTIIAGVGGNGTGAGGAGGALTSVTLNAVGSIFLQGGNGGTGGSGTAGAGGQAALSGADSLTGNVVLIAGDGGVSGAAPGDGGAISQFIASAGGNIAMQAGSGHAGGAGGAIVQSGTSLNQLTNLPNLGITTIHAGNGSAGNNVAGVGGDVSVFNGEVGRTGSTTLTAGNGGGGTGATQVAAGGSVSQVVLSGSNGVGGGNFLAFDAGNAGVSDVAKSGADGGSVTNVTISGLSAGSVVHHFAAGDASSGKKHGGTGGSVTNIHVGAVGDTVANIGIESGAYFGYSTDRSLSGGIFAGLGGTGSKSSGANGNVEQITAAAISGIVAGKPTQIATRPGLVTTVDGITLEGPGSNELRANANGSFINFGTANFVGSVYNNGNGPTAAGASTYHAGDGLIAAVGLPTNTNFPLDVFLTLDGNGNRELANVQLPNLIEVTFDPAPANLI